jgi:hypothetical protein
MYDLLQGPTGRCPVSLPMDTEQNVKNKSKCDQKEIQNKNRKTNLNQPKLHILLNLKLTNYKRNQTKVTILKLSKNGKCS